HPILTDVSFRIAKNEMVGIIGPSGAGKTTIADLMLRLFVPDNGEIAIDGKDISRFSLHDFRRHIGYVSQDIFLMNDTIADNIKFYNDSIDETHLIEAARMANIYDFIMSLDKGFKTIIGDRGILLSGGQRQRVILARALVRKPAILILDEATSALDNESEALIQKSIEGLKGSVTVIVIAHRLSTIIRCDRLIGLEDGKIVEVGTPQELLENDNSYFSKVYNLAQKKDE
ncbi:MAG: ATP-binding cassette domain-containing protein, partial [Patescibacteria group bacterium]